MSFDPTEPALPPVRPVHLVLVGGASVILGMFLFLVYGLHIGPLLPPGSQSSILGYGLAAISVGATPFALLVLRPRAGRRNPGQTVDAYWDSESRAGPLLFWVVAEGGGVMGAVGFLMSGSLLPLLASAGSIAILAAVGPGYFEDQ
jgi:hypothetical protein